MSLLIDAELSNNKNNPIGNSILQPVSANNGVLGHLGSGCNTIESLVTLQNQVVSMGDFVKQAAQGPCKMQLVWGDSATTLMLQMKRKKRNASTNTAVQSTLVDPSWFEEGPFQRLGVSGGTAPFFQLYLTAKGMQQASHNNEPVCTTT